MVVKNERREAQGNWLDLLNYVKAEGKRDASVQRYKGLGEMNAEQLAETTMNPEKRTLLVVRLEDMVLRARYEITLSTDAVAHASACCGELQLAISGRPPNRGLKPTAAR